MTAYFKSDRGKVRPINEDAGGVFKHPSGQLLTVIADGRVDTMLVMWLVKWPYPVT